MDIVNDSHVKLLNLRRLPGRLSMEQSACLLGMSTHDIPVLIRAGIISPLGKPEPNAPKYFAAIEIERIARSAEEMDRAVKALSKHWKVKNRRQISPPLKHVAVIETGSKVAQPENE